MDQRERVWKLLPVKSSVLSSYYLHWEALQKVQLLCIIIIKCHTKLNDQDLDPWCSCPSAILPFTFQLSEERMKTAFMCRKDDSIYKVLSESSWTGPNCFLRRLTMTQLSSSGSSWVMKIWADLVSCDFSWFLKMKQDPKECHFNNHRWNPNTITGSNGQPWEKGLLERFWCMEEAMGLLFMFPRGLSWKGQRSNWNKVSLSF